MGSDAPLASRMVFPGRSYVLYGSTSLHIVHVIDECKSGDLWRCLDLVSERLIVLPTEVIRKLTLITA